MKNMIVPLLLALLAGTLVPLQTGANTYLSKGLGNSGLSTLVVFIVAMVATLAFLLLQRPALPTSSQLSQIPWHAWCTGGVLGAVYIFLLIYTAPRLGMASTVGLVILGQLLMAMVVDHFGWYGMTIMHFNWKRLAGALIMVLGLWIIKKY